MTARTAGLLARALRGALAGLLAGLAVFAADFLVTYSTHSARFDPSPETWTLLGFIAVAPVASGLLLGLVGGALLRRGLSGKAIVLAPVGAFLVAGLVFFALRVEPHRPVDRPAAGVNAERRADVLWIVLDTLRADALFGPDGQFPDAPAIGAFAATAGVFTEAEAPAGWTIPSTASLLTGLLPGTMQARRGLLPSGALTAAELLRAAGWQTRAQIDNTLLDESNGFAAGFDGFEKRIPMDFGWAMQLAKAIPPGFQEEIRHGFDISYAGADRLVDRAIDDIEQAGDEPLFLYVHAMDVHAPYRHKVLDPDLAEVAETLPGLDGTGRDMARRRPDFLSEDQKAAIRSLYRAELVQLDVEIGRLLAAFDARRTLDDAIVLLTADHGEEFWEHGKMGHGHALYGEIARVPLLLRFPSALVAGAAPRRVATPVSLEDVLPSVVDALGIERETEPLAFEGVSLLPLIRGQTLERAPLYAEQFRFNRELRRWRHGDEVLVWSQLPDDRELVQLFDVRADPGEQNDVAGERPERTAELKAELDAFLAARANVQGIDIGDAETNAAGLKALGYAGH